VKNDDSFKKDGYNIVSNLNLTVSEAVLGTTKMVPTIWGEVEVNNNFIKG